MALRAPRFMTILGIMLFSKYSLAHNPATPASTQASTHVVPEDLALRALYWNFPPFVMPNTGISQSTVVVPSGAMSKIISDMFVTECLPSGSQVAEWTMMDTPRAVHDNRDGYDIIFPVSRTSMMASLMQTDTLYQFIPVTESPGVSVLRCTSLGHSAVYLSILGTWPLGLALISTAVLAGIIIWVLDTHWNPDGFPQPFSKGLWEGVWWAWVTMSTVGYGDKTPKGIPGRVFAYLWILVGIIFMSIFTAAVTNAISTDLSSKASITGEKVGVINGTTDEWLALSQGADVTVYDESGELLSAVKDGMLDAVLMDSLRVISASAVIESNGISTVGTINAPSVHGVLVHNMSHDVVRCFTQIVDRYHYEIFDYVKQVDYKHIKKQNVQDSTAALFVGNSTSWIYILVGFVLGLIIILLAGEFVFSKFIKTTSRKIEADPTIKMHANEKQSIR